MAAGLRRVRAWQGPCARLPNIFCCTSVHDQVSSLGQKHDGSEEKRQPRSLRGSLAATATPSGNKKSHPGGKWLNPAAHAASSSQLLRPYVSPESCLDWPGAKKGCLCDAWGFEVVMPWTASADFSAPWAAIVSIYMLYNVLNCAHLFSVGRSTFFTSQYQFTKNDSVSLPTHYPNYQIELVSFHTIQS